MKKNIPNILTITRIIFAGIFVCLFELKFFLAAFIVYIFSSVTDFLDGQIARKYNMVSDFGKFADPLADKILVFSALILFVKYNFTPAWIVIFILFRELTITGLRLVFSSKGTVIPAMFSGKLKTTVQVVVIIFILFLFVLSKGAIWSLNNPLTISLKVGNWLLFFVTLYSFIDYLFRLDLRSIF
jgi:CDP-diacylglycerol--glycerol-3-phosphate 3-phosphatidyltransferase